jgi:hypothetical protein
VLNQSGLNSFFLFGHCCCIVLLCCCVVVFVIMSASEPADSTAVVSPTRADEPPTSDAVVPETLAPIDGDDSPDSSGSCSAAPSDELPLDHVMDSSSFAIDSELEALAELEKGDHFDRDLYDSIHQLLPSDDPLDQPNFNPVDYLNQLFPNGMRSYDASGVLARHPRCD